MNDGCLQLELNEFMANMTRLGIDVRRECALAVADHAQRAVGLIGGAYPSAHPRKGRQHATAMLKARVYTRKGNRNGGYGAEDDTTWTVFSSAPHAWLYNNGSKRRFDATRDNADRGRMPKNNVVGGVMSDMRRDLEVVARQIIDKDRRL